MSKHPEPAYGVLAKFVLSFLLTVSFPFAALGLQVEVEQGGLARWTDEGITACGMDGQTWAPVEGTCYFPVDLDRTPGTVEIARWTEAGIATAWLKVRAKEYDLQNIDFPDESYVHLSEENLARLYREQAEVKPLFRRRGGLPRFTLPTAAPLDPLPEGRYFGVRRTFNGEPKSRHTGTDYAVGLDNPVSSMADGTVVLAAEHFFAGRSVYVHHGNGLVSMYFHLNEISVEVGQEVKQGEAIGKVGSTGRSTGPHLHLGVRWHRARIDPELLLKDPTGLPTVE